jgi:hypothetical protein
MFATEPRRFFVIAAALTVLSVLAAPAVTAEVKWRSGAPSAPQRMQPAEIGQAVLELASRPGQSRVVLHLDGPVQPGQRAALAASGIRLLSYLGGHAYFASLAEAPDAARIAARPDVVAIEAIDPLNKMHPDLVAGITHPWAVVSETEAKPPVVALYLLFHRDFDLDQAQGLIDRFGGTIRSRMESVHGVVAHLPADRVAGLAEADGVMYVEPPLPQFEQLNDQARALTGVDTVNAPPYSLDGSGVTVLVYDGGQVLDHNDLAGRLTHGDNTGVSDHSTHVACTIGGDAVSGSLSGMAPATQIVSYAFEQQGGLQQGFLYTDPGDLESDYSEAITDHGADLSNNSIGTNTASNGFPCDWEGNYGTTGALIDEVVRGSLGEPFRVVWANGNERGSGACGSTYQTTAPPACAKNHVTVGALNSNDDSITSFTSWGPCDDGRLKPDVSAPGCQSNGDGGISSCSSSGGYTTKCGTSMASPTTAGVSALLLQQYRESFPGRPDFRNSLLRALLAQTAVDLGNPGPDFQSGYGSIRAQPAADAIIDEKFVEDVVSQGEVYTFKLSVGSGSDVKVTLAWDDPAGTPNVNPVLVNDLDLRIIGPDQIVHYPWTLDPGNPGAAAVRTVRDGVNNIEQVVVSNATPGTYIVEIEGFNIAEGPEQPFGVATSHTPVFCTEYPTFGGVASVTPGGSCGEIDLSWNTGQSNCSPAGEITYAVYRGEGPLFVPVLATRIHEGLAVTSITDVGLDPGKRYYYVVRAEDSRVGEEGNINRRSAIPPASPDTSGPIFGGLQSIAPGPACGEVLLDWEAALESCSAPVLFEIHRSTDPDFVPGPATIVATTFATDFVDTAVAPGTEQTYLVRAKDSQGNQEANDSRLSVSPSVFDVELFETAFEPDGAGWSVIAPNDATAGNWEWGDPDPTSYQPGDDATPDGSNCWVTGIAGGSGNGDIDDGTTTLLSAAYDMAGAVNPAVAYSRWFTNDRGGSPGDATDSLHVEVSNDDGQSWTEVEEVGAGTPLAWVPVSHALPVAPTSQMRFRFSAADLGSGSIVEALIDEFSLIDAGQACEQCTEPPAETLCSITVDRDGDDIRVDWSANPVGTRAVVYHVTGCGPADRVKLGTSLGNDFVHENAALSGEAFHYRVTFVDECGNEQAFCGTTDCP